MAVPRQLNSKYAAIIYEDAEDGLIKLRSSVSGNIRPSGLNVAGIITEITLNDTTWTALPTTALTARNAVAIQNQSGIEIKINYNNAQAGYVGMIIPDGGERFYDITDNILIYAKSASGTPTINVEEIS